MNLVGSVFFFMMQAISWAILLLGCWLDLFYIVVQLIFFHANIHQIVLIRGFLSSDCVSYGTRTVS